jgi:GNAT superfamily N-acetyltransferase
MHIRPGSEQDTSTAIAMMDSAIAWLGERGRTGQWGTVPYSERPEAVDKMTKRFREEASWLAEVAGEPAGALVLSDQAQPYVEAADEPEIYIQLLVTDRRFAGQGVGAALLDHAVAEARRQGVDLLRVDCYAGDDGRLVAYYRSQGFTPASTFKVGDWPGQLLTRRV